MKKGEIAEERIDESVRRILTLKVKLGLFKFPGVEAGAVQEFGLADYKDVALETAEASLVLLENKGDILP